MRTGRAFADARTVTLLALLCLAVPGEHVNKILAQEISGRAANGSAAPRVLQTPIMRVVQALGLRTERVEVPITSQNETQISANLPQVLPPAELPHDLLADSNARPLLPETDARDERREATNSEPELDDRVVATHVQLATDGSATATPAPELFFNESPTEQPFARPLESHAAAPEPMRPATNYVTKPKRTSVAEIPVEQLPLLSPTIEIEATAETEVEPRQVKRNRSVIIEAVERSLDGAPLPPRKKTSATKKQIHDVRQVAAFVETQPLIKKTMFEILGDELLVPGQTCDAAACALQVPTSNRNSNAASPQPQCGISKSNRQAFTVSSQHEKEGAIENRSTSGLRSRSPSNSINTGLISGPFGHGR